MQPTSPHQSQCCDGSAANRRFVVMTRAGGAGDPPGFDSPLRLPAIRHRGDIDGLLMHPQSLGETTHRSAQNRRPGQSKKTRTIQPKTGGGW
jgi:hypothetical protein